MGVQNPLVLHFFMFHYQGGTVLDFENLLLGFVFFISILLVFPIPNCMYAGEFVSLCLYTVAVFVRIQYICAL